MESQFGVSDAVRAHNRSLIPKHCEIELAGGSLIQLEGLRKFGGPDSSVIPPGSAVALSRMRRLEEANQGHDSRSDRSTPQPNGDPSFDASDRTTPSLQIAKTRSTSNLTQFSPKTRNNGTSRFSLDAGTWATDSEARQSVSLVSEHDHGLGLSGLRRIRQSRPSAAPSAATSRSASISLSRSASISTLLSHGGPPLASDPLSSSFAEDLSRFPSESLHSFSFAHQSEELLHNRQNVLKRSMDFLQDRRGRGSLANVAGLASAHARVTGDSDMQNMLGLLSKAKLVGALNIPHGDPTMFMGPLTGPADVGEGDVFDNEFSPRTASPDRMDTTPTSPATVAHTTNTSPEQPSDVGQDIVKASDRKHGLEHSASLALDTDATADAITREPQRPSGLKRTLTDIAPMSIQQKLMDVMAQPFVSVDADQADDLGSPTMGHSFSHANNASRRGSSVHGHSNRWVPAAQAIFTTENKAPWTIIAANDLACLLFGVTTAEVRKMGILEVVQKERRGWLESKLTQNQEDDETSKPSEAELAKSRSVDAVKPRVSSNLLGNRGGGITARLLSKPSSRQTTPPKINVVKRPASFHSGDDGRPHKMSSSRKPSARKGRTNDVLLCGDVVPIQKRNGATGSASFWVKEKKVGLIWVLEEIREDIAFVTVDDEAIVQSATGEISSIWGEDSVQPGHDISLLVPRLPRQGIDPREGPLDYNQIRKRRYYTCQNADKINIPATIEQVRGKPELRISSFPHIAGIIVLDPDNLRIKSSNSAFCGALFGNDKTEGLSITALIPDLDKVLRVLVEIDGVDFAEGIVIPEHNFRRAFALIALRENRGDAANTFLRPEGLPAKHRDGSELKIDVQMRIVKSEKQSKIREETVLELSEDDDADMDAIEAFTPPHCEIVYALWITYSRHLHATNSITPGSPMLSGSATPMHQPSPGQTALVTPHDMTPEPDEKRTSAASRLSKQLKDVALNAAAALGRSPSQKGRTQVESRPSTATREPSDQPRKTKYIDDFTILEDMGQGAYGQVRLARSKATGKMCVIKYVTKRRILVDTWIRDRRLGTVPLEIHVLEYLRRDGHGHPNIVEMEDFFEDDVNYYIEMVPHGLPGMDLFDYIELRTDMAERECRSVFVQVARAVHHLHVKALVVHRDIKDENVILDGEGNIKLIDFGSAAYIRSGPFDVFVGTIDYAAPEVLAGKPYGGKEQDVWALGILLYTIIYKENPFYSIDEIMDRDLRIPYTISDESIDLIKGMLNRDVGKRFDIERVMAHPWCQMEDEEDGDD